MTRRAQQDCVEKDDGDLVVGSQFDWVTRRAQQDCVEKDDVDLL